MASRSSSTSSVQQNPILPRPPHGYSPADLAPFDIFIGADLVHWGIAQHAAHDNTEYTRPTKEWGHSSAPLIKRPLAWFHSQNGTGNSYDFVIRAVKSAVSALITHFLRNRGFSGVEVDFWCTYFLWVVINWWSWFSI